jgi:hypothetical protein
MAEEDAFDHCFTESNPFIHNGDMLMLTAAKSPMHFDRVDRVADSAYDHLATQDPISGNDPVKV